MKAEKKKNARFEMSSMKWGVKSLLSSGDYSERVFFVCVDDVSVIGLWQIDIFESAFAADRDLKAEYQRKQTKQMSGKTWIYYEVDFVDDPTTLEHDAM